jgi:dolichol kinase
MIQLLGPIMRSHEVDRLAGTFYYALGCWIAATLFPKCVTVLAILYLSWVDPVASAVGILFPSVARHSNGKSLLGILVGACACAVVSTFYLSETFPSITPLQIAVVAVSGSIVAGLAELSVPTPPSGVFPFNTDDNFVIPTISSIFLYLIMGACGLLNSPTTLLP